VAGIIPPTTPLTPTIFISYRHEEPSTMIARKLYTALVPAADTWEADLFMDEHELEPGDLFDERIRTALDRTTHFIVLLTNAYWSSEYCRQELSRAVERYETERNLRVLFVLVEDLDPALFSFNRDRRAGRINSDHPAIQKIGDVQFLGPFDRQLRLVRLAWDDPGPFTDQIAQLVKRVGEVIHR
jgi:hypothetical protein